MFYISVNCEWVRLDTAQHKSRHSPAQVMSNDFGKEVAESLPQNYWSTATDDFGSEATMTDVTDLSHCLKFRLPNLRKCLCIKPRKIIMVTRHVPKIAEFVF